MVLLFNDFHEFSSIHYYRDRFASNQLPTIVLLVFVSKLMKWYFLCSPCHGQLELYHVIILNNQLCVFGYNSITENKTTI